jgi:hypothetical protein
MYKKVQTTYCDDPYTNNISLVEKAKVRISMSRVVVKVVEQEGV